MDNELDTRIEAWRHYRHVPLLDVALATWHPPPPCQLQHVQRRPNAVDNRSWIDADTPTCDCLSQQRIGALPKAWSFRV